MSVASVALRPSVDRTIDALADYERLAMRALVDSAGKDAADQAMRRVLFQTCGIIAAELGPRRLRELLLLAGNAIPEN